jgi:hypothetical protein
MAQPTQKLMQYKVTSPSGQSFMVTAPEGSSQQSILDYVELNAQKQKNDALRSDLQNESWLSRNLKGVMTAPSNLLEGGKQLAQELMNPQQYVNPKTGETSSSPIQGYQALPKQQYDTSQIKKNRIIAEEAPVGAIAGNVGTALATALIPGANTKAGSMLAGGAFSGLQPTLGSESRLENATIGALTGGAVNAPQLLEKPLKAGANRLMMSAVKPGKNELKSGEGQQAVQTLLEEGVNPTVGRTIFGRGLDTLQAKVDSLNEHITEMIANSGEKVSKSAVLKYLDDLENSYKYQLDAGADVSAVKSVKKAFENSELLPKPKNTGLLLPTQAIDDFDVQLAQRIKQGTYKAIGDKNFNELGGAAKEAQRAGARGLKEEIARVEPTVNLLNKKESELINALDVAESRAYTALKNNPVGIAGLSNNPVQLAGMMADRSDAFKALVARMMYQTGKAVGKIPQATNQGLVGVPMASALTSYNQLNTDSDTLNTNETLNNPAQSKKARKIGKLLMRDANQGEQ